MRRDWDDRARQDAFCYIASWRKDWDLASFLRSGAEDYGRLVVPYLAGRIPDPSACTVLELGCGAGRMTHCLAGRFGHVIAFDISPVMLERGRELLRDISNVKWVCGNGRDLTGVQTESVDLVFSYLVLQHLPSEDLVWRYIQEILRVVRRGGFFLLQFNGMQSPTMNWRGRLAWKVIDSTWAVGLRSLSRWTASALGFDPNLAGLSWRGVAMDAGRMRELVQEAGGEVQQVAGEKTPFAWICGCKTA